MKYELAIGAANFPSEASRCLGSLSRLSSTGTTALALTQAEQKSIDAGGATTGRGSLTVFDLLLAKNRGVFIVFNLLAKCRPTFGKRSGSLARNNMFFDQPFFIANLPFELAFQIQPCTLESKCSPVPVFGPRQAVKRRSTNRFVARKFFVSPLYKART